WKLAMRMEDPGFIKRFARSGRPGAYFRIIEEGELGAGDAIEVVERPDHDITIAFVAHVYLADHDAAQRLLEAPAPARAAVPPLAEQPVAAEPQGDGAVDLQAGSVLANRFRPRSSEPNGPP